MSAFIVSEACIHRCVAALLGDRESCEDGDRLGAELYVLNQRSVQARYPGDTTGYADIPEGYRYKPTRPGRIQMLKALESWRHQCSEARDVEATALYERITRRINDLAREIVRDLPEYEKAVWG